MDPKAMLEIIRTNARALVEGRAHDRLARADELAQAVMDLDEWLSRGGFLPRAWEPRTAPDWH